MPPFNNNDDSRRKKKVEEDFDFLSSEFKMLGQNVTTPNELIEEIADLSISTAESEKTWAGIGALVWWGVSYQFFFQRIQSLVCQNMSLVIRFTGVVEILA